MRQRQVPLAFRIVRLACHHRRSLALRLAIGLKSLCVLSLRQQRIPEHGARPVADRRARSLLAGKLRLAPKGGLRGVQPAVTQEKHASEHLRLGIVRRKVGCPGVGAHGIPGTVEQREGAQLTPIGGLAAVEAVSVQLLAQQMLGFRALSPGLNHHRTGGRLDVCLEHGTGAKHRSGGRSLDKRLPLLGETLAQLVLEVVDAPLEPA